jgi:hypothetical protein
MPELTEFQIVTEKALEELLAEFNRTLEGRKVSGRTEMFIEGHVDDINIWIYTDGACLIGRGVDRVLEKWGYDSLGDLRVAFLDQLRALLA